jgi:hypothetical protein
LSQIANPSSSIDANSIAVTATPTSAMMIEGCDHAICDWWANEFDGRLIWPSNMAKNSYFINSFYFFNSFLCWILIDVKNINKKYNIIWWLKSKIIKNYFKTLAKYFLLLSNWCLVYCFSY